MLPLLAALVLYMYDVTYIEVWHWLDFFLDSRCSQSLTCRQASLIG
jgi:hypothetical protein